MSGETYTIIGFCLTVLLFLFSVIFKTGHVAARVEELERWRVNVRQDFHEVSEQLGEVAVALKQLTTIIEERTERRINIRTSTPKEG